MKNIFLALLLVLISATFSFSGTSDSENGVLAFSDIDNEIPLSPKVVAQYTDGDNEAGVANQWYVAGTTHQGGTFTYATAAGITKIYKLANGDGGNQFDAMPTTPQSESVWSDEGWSL